MIEKIRKNMKEGINRIKWIAAFLAERTRAETFIAKLLYESSKLEDRMDELYRDIGERVLELKEKGEKSVFKDFIIQQAFDEINNLRKTVSDYKEKARELSNLP